MLTMFSSRHEPNSLAQTEKLCCNGVMKHKLPVGIQDFVGIREDGCYYVDKTALIHTLVNGSGKTFFLSRPRRFGKSLLCSTLGALFDGRRELFAASAAQPALAIDSLEWDWKKHPVIRIDLSPGNYERGVNELLATINTALGLCARKYGVALEGDTISAQFMRLINTLREKAGEKVVVIIDEYDKPLLSTIDEPALHKEMRSTLKGFYSVLKATDGDLRFTFLTGVTKFSHVSVFSDLNHITDISLEPRYAELCGITQEELERNFADEISEIIQNKGTKRETYLMEVKQFYNGYRFSRKPLTVYNPYGLLKHFYSGGEFLPFWFESGTPTFLIKLIENQHINILDLGKQTVRYADLGKYDVETMQAVPVLYQSGYLTINEYNSEEDVFSLDYPNAEVRASFAESLAEKYLRVPDENLSAFIINFISAIYKGNVDYMMNALKPLIASIPHDLITKNENENYYQTVIHLVFTMMGLQCRSEVRIADGRIDTLLETSKFVYCFEFKLEGSAQTALAQIDSKDYLLPWRGRGKKLFKVGVNFDREKRNISEWKVEIKEKASDND
jgi:hypothetical protein